MKRDYKYVTVRIETNVLKKIEKQADRLTWGNVSALIRHVLADFLKKTK